MRIKDILEGWSDKYKRSINCANPKGFSQRAHCQGRKKTEDVEQDLKELGTSQYKVTEPRDMVNVDFRTKQITYKVFKFKVDKQVFMIVLTVKDGLIPGIKKKVPTLNVAFGRQDKSGWDVDDIDTNLTGDNQNQFQIYSTVIKAVQKFINQLNPNVGQIIIKGDNERQQVMYDRFFSSRYLEKFFPGWHLHPVSKSLVRDQV